MWTAALILLYGGAMIWFGRRGSHKRLQTWQDAAQSCGLQVVETSGPFKARAGLVEVWIGSSGDKALPIRIVVEAPGPPEFHKVKIRPQPLFQWVREIEVGDKSFDVAYFIEGPVRLVFALLDAETRRLLSDPALGNRLEISSGKVQANLIDKKVPDVLPLLQIGRAH